MVKAVIEELAEHREHGAVGRGITDIGRDVVEGIGDERFTIVRELRRAVFLVKRRGRDVQPFLAEPLVELGCNRVVVGLVDDQVRDKARVGVHDAD